MNDVTQNAPKLPNMNEFSPTVVGDLGNLLDIVQSHVGDRMGLKTAIFENSNIKFAVNEQHLNRANNVLIGLSECGLFDLDTNQLTVYGEMLYEMQSENEKYLAFAKHLLQECHGIDLLDVVRSLKSRYVTITLESIRNELKDRGFRVTFNEGNPSKIRMWLEKAGVVDKHWNIDEERYSEVLGISARLHTEWLQLTKSQQAFLITLRHLTVEEVPTWKPVDQIIVLGRQKYGRYIFPEGPLREKVIYPLQSLGWIESQGKGLGRGGKSGDVQATQKLLEIHTELEELKDLSGRIPSDLLIMLNKPLREIYRDLVSQNKNVKGKALELLSIRLIQNLGLMFVAFRKRSEKTQGAEIDVLAEGSHLLYSRWLVQCKNTPRSHVDVEDLAKEIGLAIILRAHVVMMVTTGDFTREVKRYAEGTARETYLQVILINRGHLDNIRQFGEGRIVDILRDQVGDILQVKSAQVTEIIEPESQ